jgi:hypothetical protein
VAPLPSDSDVAGELRCLRESVDELGQRLAALNAENVSLRQRLDDSETARRDLLAQTEHVIELLANSRREVRELKQKATSS